MLNKLIASSVGPKKVSLTVQGIFALLAPLLGMIVQYYGHSISNDQVNEIIEGVTNLIIVGSSFFSAIMILVGLARKIIHSYKS